MQKNTKATSVRGNPESFTISEAKEDMNMDTQGNVNNPSGQNPRPNAKAGIIHGTRFLLSESNCKLPTIIITSFFFGNWKLLTRLLYITKLDDVILSLQQQIGHSATERSLPLKPQRLHTQTL